MEKKSKIVIAILCVVLVALAAFALLGRRRKYHKPYYAKPHKNDTVEPDTIVAPDFFAQKDTDSVLPEFIEGMCDKVSDKVIGSIEENIGAKRLESVVETITAEECANRLYRAMQGPGADVRSVLQIFDYIDTNEEFDDVCFAFEKLHGDTFDNVLSEEKLFGRLLAKEINKILSDRKIDREIIIE